MSFVPPVEISLRKADASALKKYRSRWIAEDLLRPAVRMRMSVMRAARVEINGGAVRRVVVVFLPIILSELVIVVVKMEVDVCQIERLRINQVARYYYCSCHSEMPDEQDVDGPLIFKERKKIRKRVCFRAEARQKRSERMSKQPAAVLISRYLWGNTK